MRLLQSGMAKSGNYWLYRIIQGALIQAGVPIQNFIKGQAIYQVAKDWELSFPEQAAVNVLDITDAGYFYRISSVFRYPISDVREYVNKNTHVWSHSPYCAKTRTVMGLFDKVIYIIRDPRDVMVSAARFTRTPYMKRFFPSTKSVDAIIEEKHLVSTERWANHVLGYWANGSEDIHVVFYERLLHELDNEVNRLLEYLSISLSKEQIDTIKESVSFSGMNASAPNHVRKAALYDWKEVLSSKQKDAISERYGNILKAFNYPVSDSEETLPCVPGSDCQLSMSRKEKGANQIRDLTVRERLRLIKRAISL